ncbi:MAG: 30S ribosomal protein S6 [Chloroflexi bacterium]|nr:MAG: 30S ribosomal protein S6 [Chloroflexota bacterium]
MNRLVRHYELVFIVHPEVDEDDLTAVVERVTGLIERNGGEVGEVKPWGMRRLAYPIQKQREGQYVLIRCDIEPQSIAEFEHDLKLIEPIMRHLIVRVEPELEETPS